jgi:integrase
VPDKTVRKTGKPRRIPIGRKFGELLDQAIGNRTEGPVFLSPKGKQWKVGNLSRTYSRLRDDSGLPKDLVLYVARHECGTKICREKGSNTPADFSATPTSARGSATCT